jgi:hypothetical protein
MGKSTMSMVIFQIVFFPGEKKNIALRQRPGHARRGRRMGRLYKKVKQRMRKQEIGIRI